MPAPFFEQPELVGMLRLHWVAFADLSTERQIGMGIGPIPRSRIIEYGRDELGFSDDALDGFAAVIRAADDAYLALVNKTPGKENLRDEVSARDGAGVRAMLHRLAKPKAARG